jgi:hypothetical protein
MTTERFISPDQIQALAEAHIRHFVNLLSGRSRFQINESECCAYLNLWKAIKSASPSTLDARQKQEIAEAIFSGDYDHIMAIDHEADELLALPTT